ncbi:hypothetical protein RSAG8_05894, partial [Rhizoctonia solani AG-8 WAC10335]
MSRNPNLLFAAGSLRMDVVSLEQRPPGTCLLKVL